MNNNIDINKFVDTDLDIIIDKKIKELDELKIKQINNIVQKFLTNEFHDLELYNYITITNFTNNKLFFKLCKTTFVIHENIFYIYDGKYSSYKIKNYDYTNNGNDTYSPFKIYIPNIIVSNNMLISEKNFEILLYSIITIYNKLINCNKYITN